MKIIKSMKKPVAVMLQIPQPCEEDWEQMKPSGCGRFCSRCEKTVIDFTLLGDEQIARLLLAHKDKQLCGHAYADQLNRPILVPQVKKNSLIFPKAAIAATLLAPILPLLPARAQSRVRQSTTLPAGEHTAKRIYIKGSIRDAATGKPLTGMEIHVNTFGVKYSDATGHFSFVLPDSFIGREIRISAAYQPSSSPELPNSLILEEKIVINGPNTYTLELLRYPEVQMGNGSDQNDAANILIEAASPAIIRTAYAGGIGSGVSAPVKKRGIWQRVKYIFRKKNR